MSDVIITLGKLLVIILAAVIATEIVFPIYLHFGCSTYDTVWQTMKAYWGHEYRVVKRFIFGCDKEQNLTG